jgi:hypothetical protein
LYEESEIGMFDFDLLLCDFLEDFTGGAIDVDAGYNG